MLLGGIRLVVVGLMVSSATLAQAGSLAEGQKDYGRFCQSCHGARGQGNLAQIPDFSHGEGLMQSDRALKRRIEEGKGLCPAYRVVLSEERINNVVRYLRTLR